MKLVTKLNRADWLPNMEKSMLEPASKATFLNGEWGQKRVQRQAADSTNMFQLIDIIDGSVQVQAMVR